MSHAIFLLWTLGMGHSTARAPAKPQETQVPPAMQNVLEKAVETHIRAQAKENEGLFPLYDEASDETFALQLLKVSSQPPMKVLSTTYILRARFLSAGDPEFGEKDLDVLADFILMLDGKRWRVRDEAVFSVDGIERFYYTQDFKRVRISPED